MTATPALHGGPLGSPVLQYDVTRKISLALCRDDIHMHKPRLALDDHIIPRSFRVRSCLPIARDTRVYKTWVDLAAVLPSKSHLGQFTGNIILYQNIRRLDELVQNLEAFGIFKVDSH